MADATWREHERTWQADPGNQDALLRAIAARRRVGLPVPGRMLERQVHAPQVLESEHALTVTVTLPDGRSRGCGRTPGAVTLPEHRVVWLQPATPSDASLRALADDGQAADEVEALSLAPDVTEVGLAELARFPGLRRLDLAGCTKVNAAGLARVAQVGTLEALDLWSVPGVDAEGLAEVARLGGLVTLNLRRCRGVTEAGLAPLSALGELSVLSLGDCPRVTSGALAALAGLTNLVALDLSATPIDDAGLERLLGLRELTLLNLSRTRVTVKGLERLAALPSLAQLYLAGCGADVARAERDLQRALPRCEVVVSQAAPPRASAT
jgi:hypothetical protein